MTEFTDTTESGVVESQQSADDDAILTAALESESTAEGDIDNDEGDQRTYKITVDGEELELTEKQLVERAQKGIGAEKRFQQAAEMRKAAENERAVYQQEQANLAAHIQNLQQQAAILAAQDVPDMQKLLDENPHEYLRVKEQLEHRQQALAQIQQAQAYLMQQQQVTQQHRLAHHVAVEQDKLLEAIPEWRDKKVRAREEQELIKFLREEEQLTDAELQQLNYSTAATIRRARDLMRYRQLQKKAATLKAPKTPGEAQPARTVSGSGRAVKDPSQMTDAEFAKWRRSQIQSRYK